MKSNTSTDRLCDPGAVRVESGSFQTLSRSLAMKVKKRGEYYHLVGRDPRDWRKQLSISLGTKDELEALCKAGEMAANMKRGIEPQAGSTRIKNLPLPNLGERDQRIRDLHIDPFFGNIKPRDMTKELIERYMVKRWGFKEGKIQAVKNTWKKESSVLIRIMRLADPLWKIPKIDYKATYKDKLPPLTFEQVKQVGNRVYPKYQAVYWVMVWTGMDIMDAVTLAPCHIKDGWIDKLRSKTRHADKPPVINIPVCKGLAKILKSVPRPLDPNEPLFTHINNKYASKEIRKAFDRAGLGGYGAKYLRRYVASVMLDGGYSREWIGKALAHSEDSEVTMKYPEIYPEKLKEAFKLLDNVGKTQAK